MTATMAAQHSVRRELMMATRDIHEALHRDPLLTRLTDKEINATEYTAALGVFSTYYNGIEACRRGFDKWSSLSLAPDCAALALDVPKPQSATDLPEFADALELLGGLYVAHGSAFGRSVFYRTIRQALPKLEHNFLSTRHDVLVWQALLDRLEEQGEKLTARMSMKIGAQKSFEFMSALSRSS